jgi:hypothetical protein
MLASSFPRCPRIGFAVESDPVILNLDPKIIGRIDDLKVNVACAAMLDNISQCLLSDSKCGVFHFDVHARFSANHVERVFNMVSLANGASNFEAVLTLSDSSWDNHDRGRNK